MGLGEIFTRDFKLNITDTSTGDQINELIVTGTGAYPSWNVAGGVYRGALGVAAAWRASIMVSDALGRLPWHAYRTRRDLPPEKLPTPPLLERPSPPETRMDTFSAWALDLLFHGNALGIYAARDFTGYPTAITPISAEHIAVKRVADGDGIPLPIGTVAYLVNNARWYSSDDIFHVRGPHAPGQLRGLGVLEAHLTRLPSSTLGLAAALAEQAGGVGTSGIPSMKVKVLNPDLNEAEAAALKAKVLETQRTRSPMVLNPATDIEPISWNPSETQLLEARKLSDVQVANLFHLSADWVNAAQTSRVYQNVEQEGLNFWRHSAGGHLARFEQTLSLCLPRGQWVEASLDAELRPDTKTRYEAHSVAITAGFLTRDEVRELERRPPLTPEQREELVPPTPAPSAAPAGPGASTTQDDVALARALDEAAEEYEAEIRAADEWWDELTDEERANFSGDGESLKHYWTKGKGLAKWAKSPHPFRALLRHLRKYLPPGRAEQTTAAWFKIVFGYAPSARQGKNPVGRG